MTTKRYFLESLLLIIFSIQLVFCQPINVLKSDTLNKIGNNGKKNGYWIEYVDTSLQPTQKDKAAFWRYIFYINGVRADLQAGINFKSILKVEGNQSIKDTIVILNGTYRIYNRKKKLCLEEIYIGGKKTMSKSFTKQGRVIELIDYTKQYKNEMGSAYLEENDGEIILKAYLRVINGKYKAEYFETKK